jgi:hypothetical protein
MTANHLTGYAVPRSRSVHFRHHTIDCWNGSADPAVDDNGSVALRDKRERGGLRSISG